MNYPHAQLQKVFLPPGSGFLRQNFPKVEEEDDKDEVKDGESEDEKCDCTHCSLKFKPCLGTPSSGNWIRPSPRRK